MKTAYKHLFNTIIYFFEFHLYVLLIYVFSIASTTIRSCTHGELRLVGGPNIRQGRLEICVNKAWGSVCSSGFFDEDAAVACAQMNFEREGVSILLCLTEYQATSFCF